MAWLPLRWLFSLNIHIDIIKMKKFFRKLKLDELNGHEKPFLIYFSCIDSTCTPLEWIKGGREREKLKSWSIENSLLNEQHC